MDGSQKIPQRWLATLAHHQRHGGQCPAILTALAAWMTYVRGDFGPVDDPMAKQLAEFWSATDQGGIVDALFGRLGLFAAHWRPTPADAALLCQLMEDRPCK
jgi:fructuronate reductase